LAPPSSSVVLRDLEPEVQQTHYIDSRPPMNRQSSVRVVLKSGRTTGEDSGPPALGTIEETAEDDDVSLGSSDAEMDFTRLNEETQHAAQEVRFDRESSVAVEPDEDEYQHINQEPLIIQRRRTTKANNPTSHYDLWGDLALARANISFGQLIQLAPSLRKQMREGATVRREARFLDETKCAEDFELNSMEEDWDVIEIDVQIVDKIIPHTMIDEGSSINVMPLSTMNKLGLSITEPSFSVIHVADHRTCKPSGRIRNLNVNTGGENYKLTFEVLPIKGGPGDFPLLLGRGFLRKSGGVANWSAKKPIFTYGPPTNRTTVLIKPRAFFYDKVIKPIMPTSESLPGNTEFAEKNPLFTKADLQETIQCIGPGLYDFKDDGTLSQWLADNPYSDDEATVEVTNCIIVLEAPPVQDLSSSQMEAEQEQVRLTSNSTPTQEDHFSNGAAQRIWICNSEEEVPNQRGEVLVALSKTRYSYNPADDTIIFRPWLNYLDEKDRVASKWMKEEVEGASTDEENGGSPHRLSNNWETSYSQNEGSTGRSLPEGGLCKEKH
jgi:hypothetical protein